MNHNNYCVILAGGVGRRLWPVSRENCPKQFIDFFGMGRSLLQMTYDRVSQFIPQENIYVSTTEEYADLARKQLPVLTDEQLLCEPVRLSTGPTAAWASWHIARRNPAANVAIIPADQMITGEAAYANELLAALDFVASHEEFLAIGVPATAPNTAYGYIQKGREMGNRLYEVKDFTEKPPRPYAETFVRSGEFLWNTGIILWNVSTMARLLPDIIPGLTHSDIIISNREEERSLVNLCYPTARRVTIDRTVLEGQQMVVQQCSFGWSDVGSWPVMSTVLHHTADGNAVVITPPYKEGTARLDNPVTFKGTKDTIVSVPADVAAVVTGLDGYLVALHDNVLVITPNDDPARMRHYAAELQVKHGEQVM